MANAFESGQRKSIPAVLVYARSRGRVLMIHRNSADRPGDYHSGKWNGLGGKCEPGESPLEAAAREFAEEAGIAVAADSFRPLGTLTFPGFKAHKHEDWIVFVFVVDLPESSLGSIPPKSPEGDLHWVPATDLESLNLWAGDRHFIPFVAAERPFIGTIWYKGQVVERHWVTSLARPAD